MTPADRELLLSIAAALRAGRLDPAPAYTHRDLSHSLARVIETGV